MTITLYVNWEYQEIYRTDEELVAGYLEHYCDDDVFRRWLDENYCSDEIFAFTKYDKADVEESYQEYLRQSAFVWAYDNNMEQEIEI